MTWKTNLCLICSVSIEKAVACGPNEPMYADTDVLIVQKASKKSVEMKDMATQTDPIIKKHPSTSYSYVSCGELHDVIVRFLSLFCKGALP